MISRATLLVVTLMTLATTAAAQNGPAISRNSVAAFFDDAFSVAHQDHRIAGAVVAVVYRGQVLFLGGYGWADIENRVPADPERSLFRIASITKPFVWTSLMQLRERGSLSLDDPVENHVDFEIPQTFDEPIRIRHLMTHTPGFEERAIGGAARTPETLLPLRDYLVNFMPARVRPPGEQAAYSNYGSALAGYVVERLSGRTWSDYVDDEVLSPLAMTSTNTQPEMSGELRARLARSYRFENGRFVPLDYMNINDAPAGHMSTTAADMARFMLAHLGDGSGANGRMLEAATVRQMRDTLFQPQPGIQPILHGFIRSDRNGQFVYGHGGDTNGFHSNLSLFPEHELGVFVSFNADPAARARGNLAAAFVDRFFPVTYLRQAPSPVSRAIADHVGEYLPLRRNHSTLERLAILLRGVTVSVDGNHLLVSGRDGTSRWVPVADGEFTGLYDDQTVAFGQGDDGTTYLYLNGALGTFERMSGLERPTVLQALFGFVAVVSALAVVGWGYRAFRSAPADVALPRIHVALAWLHAAAMLYLLIQLALALMGDVEEFLYGVPPEVHRHLLLLSANLLLGALVVMLAMMQWLFHQGSTGSRLRYDVVAAAALVNAWLAYDFNYATYALQAS